MNNIFTKTWVPTRKGFVLRCYTSAPDIRTINSDAKMVAKVMEDVTGEKVDPKSLGIGENKHGGYLHYSFIRTPAEIEMLLPVLKAQGWKEGK